MAASLLDESWASHLLPSQPGELVLPHDAFMSICFTLDTILIDICRFGQEAYDFEPSCLDAALTAIRSKVNSLSDSKFVRCHSGLQRHHGCERQIKQRL